MSTTSSTNPLTPRPSSKSNVPPNSRQSGKKVIAGKIGGKPNASILNFFKKVDSPLADDSIFLSQGSQLAQVPSRGKLPNLEIADSDDEDLYGDNNDLGSDRFNELGGSVKRRKTSSGSPQSAIGSNDDKDTATVTPPDVIDPSERPCSPPPPDTSTKLKAKPKKPRRRGPFLSDSESDYEADLSIQSRDKIAQETAVNLEARELRVRVSNQPQDANEIVTTDPINQEDITENKPVVPWVDTAQQVNDGLFKRYKRVPVGKAQPAWEALQPKNGSIQDTQAVAQQQGINSDTPGTTPEAPLMENEDASSRYFPVVPVLKKEETSVDEWGKFEDIDEFPDENEDFEGEEFVERKWMEEQARLEAAEDEPWNGFEDEEDSTVAPGEDMTAACPICNVSLDGITPDDASRHVNGCLDGNPVPLPEPVKPKPQTLKTAPAEIKYIPAEGASRFARKAAIARPGQANPFEIGSGDGTKASSAFSMLMSGKAEDAAWASAAAAEQSSRGKAAYQRTCPFYKIMPGFFICVDAFRYGAVQGCNAYFLSHFHSDHYVGLTATWCHGPIYCSKVTANLVKQQLRVDPKWVVALDFEARFDIPGTQGVAVTMIPANHCPGSSLYLFEKIVGRGKDPKIQRVLHCGDFRACPAHIEHPLLMPDIIDSISGKTKQQKIDVCYLDTTYLNPRYAFPSQEAVITACADMCVSLKKERAEENDAWEVVKRERAGTGMQKFVNATIKAEDDSIAMSIDSKKARGRLLVVCGTYSIGKERICMGIARALDCKIWAPTRKLRICAALEDPELMSRMTDDPNEAQIHMQMLMEIRPETLQEYLNSYKPHFSRVVGFRPSGWNYRPPNSR